MARIELRYCVIRLKDGLGLGYNGVNPTALSVGAPTQSLTSLTVDNVTIPRARYTTKIPVGARFTLAGETVQTVHVVTGRTQGVAGAVNEKQSVTVTADSGTFTLSWGGKTTGNINFDASASDVHDALMAMDDGYGTSDWIVTGSPGAYVVEFAVALGAAPRALLVADATNLVGTSHGVAVAQTVLGAVAHSTNVTTTITFAPALGSGNYADDAVLTILSQELAIKIGEGNLNYVEKKDYKYDLDRGNLDAVREGNEIPLDVKFECVYEHITTGTSENICPMDALKGIAAAAEWVSSGPDPCEPYAVDVEVEYTPPCTVADSELTTFPDFRADQKDIDYTKAMITVSGKCNVTEPIVSRIPQVAA